MTRHETVTPYNENAGDFDRLRRAGANTLGRLRYILSGVQPSSMILSLGCGSGQFEAELAPAYDLVGLDLSARMLAIAKHRLRRVVRGDMLKLPFPGCSFGGGYCVQSLHHVGATFDITTGERTAARKNVLREIWRVLAAGPCAVVQRDPSQNKAVWFWKYFPEALERKMIIQPPVAAIKEWMAEIGFTAIEAVPIVDEMNRRFYEPEAPLTPAFTRSFSEFSYLSPAELAAGKERLRTAITSGQVHEDIRRSQERFEEIGGHLFVVHGYKK
jgi:SAM-dependent methyltransferase